MSSTVPDTGVHSVMRSTPRVRVHRPLTQSAQLTAVAAASEGARACTGDMPNHSQQVAPFESSGSVFPKRGGRQLGAKNKKTVLKEAANVRSAGALRSWLTSSSGPRDQPGTEPATEAHFAHWQPDLKPATETTVRAPPPADANNPAGCREPCSSDDDGEKQPRRRYAWKNVDKETITNYHLQQLQKYKARELPRSMKPSLATTVQHWQFKLGKPYVRAPCARGAVRVRTQQSNFSPHVRLLWTRWHGTVGLNSLNSRSG